MYSSLPVTLTIRSAKMIIGFNGFSFGVPASFSPIAIA
jgi:hypothetical protein